MTAHLGNDSDWIKIIYNIYNLPKSKRILNSIQHNKRGLRPINKPLNENIYQIQSQPWQDLKENKESEWFQPQIQPS